MPDNVRSALHMVCVLMGEMKADGVRGIRKLPAAIFWQVVNVHVLGSLP